MSSDARIVSVRLRRELVAALDRAARARRVTRSQLINESLEQSLTRQPAASVYELGKDLFGRYGSGRSDTSIRARELYRTYAREKHARRRRPADRAV